MQTFIGLALGTALAAGCGSAPETQETVAERPLTVSVGRVSAVSLPSYVEVGGIVTPRSSAEVSSRVLAVVEAVRVRPGDRVRAGQQLVTLDARELSARAAQAEAGVAAATETVLAADAAVVAAEADLRLAEVTLERITQLHERRSATQQELDRAAAARDAAAAQTRGARAGASAAASSRAAAVAADEAADIARSYAVLTAPYDAVVAERHVDAGDLATPGTALLLLEEDGAPRVEVRLDDSHASLAVIGGEAEVRVDGGQGWAPARVIEIGRSDPAAHSFVVTLEPLEALAARSGSFARARFADAAHSALVVPAASVVRRGQLSLVYLMDGDGRARLRPVVTGETAGDVLEILTGLRESDTVVVSPPPALADGARVETAAGAGGGDRP